MVHIALQENTSRDYEEETPYPFPKKFFCQSQSNIPELEPKKAKTIPFKA